MAFTDELVFYLFTLAFSGLLLAYFMTDAYLDYRKGKMEIKKRLESLSLPLLLLGGYLLVIGVVSQFTWFLPGAYDILFFDPIVAFGLILIAFSLSARYDVASKYVGFMALLFGIMTVLYGVFGYNIGLTKEPLEFLALFVLFGASGIMTFPATLIIDNFPRTKSAMPKYWHFFLAVLWLLLIFAGAAAFTIAVGALPAHLANPP